MRFTGSTDRDRDDFASQQTWVIRQQEAAHWRSKNNPNALDESAVKSSLKEAHDRAQKERFEP